MLRNQEQEFILLVNEKNEFELVPYDQIINIANGSREVQAFIFTRNRDLYVVFWHISGNKELEVSLNSKDFTLLEILGREIQINSKPNEENSLIPVGNRRFIKTDKLTKDEIINAFKNSKIVN